MASVKIVEITSCTNCPSSESFCNGAYLVCNHIKVVVPKPYSSDRKCPEKGFAPFCPL